MSLEDFFILLEEHDPTKPVVIQVEGREYQVRDSREEEDKVIVRTQPD